MRERTLPAARHGYLTGTSVEWDEARLICSWCGHQYVHLLPPETHEVGDDYDPDSPLGNRGSWVDVAVVCEACERVTSVVFGFHKGQVLRNQFRRTGAPADQPIGRHNHTMT